jgi:hypothetical protein
MVLGPLRRLALITELTPRPPTLRDFKGGHTREQSGTSVDHDILRRGDGDVRTALLRGSQPDDDPITEACTLQAWGLRLAASAVISAPSWRSRASSR